MQVPLPVLLASSGRSSLGPLPPARVPDLYVPPPVARTPGLMGLSCRTAEKAVPKRVDSCPRWDMGHPQGQRNKGSCPLNSGTSVTVVPVFGNPGRGHCSRLAWTPALTGPLPVSVCTGSSHDLLGVPWQPELVSLCPLHLCGLRSSGPCSTAHVEPPRRPPLSVALSEHRVLLKVDCQGTLGPKSSWQ